MNKDRELFIKIITNKKEKYCDLDYAGTVIDLTLLIAYLIDDMSKNSNVTKDDILVNIKLCLDKGLKY